jgi:hypothetical protein
MIQQVAQWVSLANSVRLAIDQKGRQAEHVNESGGCFALSLLNWQLARGGEEPATYPMGIHLPASFGGFALSYRCERTPPPLGNGCTHTSDPLIPTPYFSAGLL